MSDRCGSLQTRLMPSELKLVLWVVVIMLCASLKGRTWPIVVRIVGLKLRTLKSVWPKLSLVSVGSVVGLIACGLTLTVNLWFLLVLSWKV